MWFLNALTGSPLLHMHIRFIRNMDKRTGLGRLLKDTILVSEAYVAYCHIVFAAEALIGERRNDELENLQFGYQLLASFIDS